MRLLYNRSANRQSVMTAMALCLVISAVQAQTLAYYKIKETAKALTLADDESSKTTFFFPHIEEYGPLTKGYSVKVPRPIRLTPYAGGATARPNTLFVRLYASNIRRIRFSAPGDSGRTVIDFPIAKDGYQLPAFLPAERLPELKGASPALDISYTLSDSSRPFSLVIGDLWLGDAHLAGRLSPSEIFIHAPFGNAVKQNNWTLSPFDSYGECAYFPSDQKEENFKGAVYIEDSTLTSTRLLTEMLLPLLEHYPFYAKKRIAKSTVLSEATAMLDRNRDLPLCPFIDTVNEFLSTRLHDPHFTIRGGCDNRKALKTPLYAYCFGGRYCVAGIFDDSLKNRLSLGAEIIAVDGRPIDSARTPTRDINGLLRRLPGDKASITVRHPDGKTEDIAWQVKDKYRIPAAFSPGNLDMKFIGDSICYYRIGKINTELPLDFASRLDSINTRKKLILDLRSNGGGDFLAGAQFLSYLINRRFHYFDYEDINTGRIDSVIVKANSTPFHYRADGKIILLVDESTACIAELVAHTLRAQRGQVTIVGRESTRGALSFLYEINLPKDKIVIATNSLDTGRFLLDGRSIEETGIAPDIRVTIEKVDDLQPYHDKVLNTAISK